VKHDDDDHDDNDHDFMTRLTKQPARRTQQRRTSGRQRPLSKGDLCVFDVMWRNFVYCCPEIV